mgnify:CR=1 FL=1
MSMKTSYWFACALLGPVSLLERIWSGAPESARAARLGIWSDPAYVIQKADNPGAIAALQPGEVVVDYSLRLKQVPIVDRGLVDLTLGLFLGLVGVDMISGQQRYTLGVPVLTDGIDVVLVAVGLFAVGEALYVGSQLRKGPVHVVPITKGWRSWMTRQDWARSWKPWLRGTAIGFPIGTIPAGGADVSTFLSYASERRLAKGRSKEEFGHGAIEGVAGPESANNAAAAGVLVPLLTLGLPTSATAAIMLAAFQRYNIQPGPLLFENESALVWALIASLYVGNVMLLALNLPLVGMWVKILQVPRHYLYAGILMFAALGAFAVNFTPADVVILVVVGLLGFFMRRYGYPVAPLVVGLILGPMFEAQLRRALAISQGDPLTLVSSTFAVVVYASLVVLMALSVWLKRRESRLEETLGVDEARDHPDPVGAAAGARDHERPSDRPTDKEKS